MVCAVRYLDGGALCRERRAWVVRQPGPAKTTKKQLLNESHLASQCGADDAWRAAMSVNVTIWTCLSCKTFQTPTTRAAGVRRAGRNCEALSSPSSKVTFRDAGDVAPPQNKFNFSFLPSRRRLYADEDRHEFETEKSFTKEAHCSFRTSQPASQVSHSKERTLGFRSPPPSFTSFPPSENSHTQRTKGTQLKRKETTRSKKRAQNVQQN